MSNVSRWAARAFAAVVSMAMVPALTPAGSASADQLRYHDAIHDVVKIDLADADSAKPVRDPAATNGDISDVFVHYRTGRLVIRANYVDLRRRKDTVLAFTGEIESNEKRRWLYQVETSPGRYAGHDQLFSYRTYRATCKIGHMFDYQENFTRVVIPLSCLSHPRWVKVSVGAATVTLNKKALKKFLESGTGVLPHGILVARGDDAGRTDVADQLSFTPRVYR